jgi:hypothetical protein
MSRNLTRIAAAAAAVGLMPLSAAIASPAQASCLNQEEWTQDPASYSDNFNASISCGAVWTLYSTVYSIQVKGQYYKDGSWQNSTLSAKWVSPTITQQQVIGDTIDGRRLRGHKVGGSSDYVIYKF